MSKILFFFSLLAVSYCQNNEVRSNQPSIPGDKNKVQETIPNLQSDVTSKNKNVDEPCTADNAEAGVCVPFYLCNHNRTNIMDTSGLGIIDIAVNDAPCESYLDTCCTVSNRRDPADPIIPLSTEKQRGGCGWRNPQGVLGFQTRGGEDEAKFAEFPWMVAILKIDPVNASDVNGQQLKVYIGGGCLIHPSVVLTTAHFVAKANKLIVRAGEWDTQTTKEIYPYQDRDVGSMEIHKDFDGGKLFYDIALLFLTKPMDLAPNVGVACLPLPKQKAIPGTRCFATSWGKDKFGKEGRYQVILKKVELPVVEPKQCRDLLRKTRLGKLFELHSTFMCAGGIGKDTCKGDSGAPLSCPIEYQENRYVQNGMVAWGIGCGEDGTPGVYVDVSVLRDWIDDKVAGKGYDPAVYSRY
ncbi:unnamed protein product [Chilo suppressalis]|uniref:Peptidase S1 domain-containing protein n=1 Tax=Chilo suppressalis TaxID=168631 RepID=A0ABN8B6D8_CHISP|nr:unnamed protein product [Chilo suppressalis]